MYAENPCNRFSMVIRDTLVKLVIKEAGIYPEGTMSLFVFDSTL